MAPVIDPVLQRELRFWREVFDALYPWTPVDGLVLELVRHSEEGQ